MQQRIRSNLLGITQPQKLDKEIRDIVSDSYYDTIILKPIYQRHIRWSKDAMNDFIGTIMNNGLVPGIILYEIKKEDKNEKNKNKNYEVVDGQHRLFTIKAFYDSTFQICAHIKKRFIVFWNYQPDIQVFYRDTPDVREWCIENEKTPYFLNEEEKTYFDSFVINITKITSKVSLEQRREIFMSLQKGIPVRNSDLLKNKTDCKFISFINNGIYEEMMTDTFIPHCTKNSPKYWVNWLTRCFILFQAYKQKGSSPNADPSIAYIITDKVIDKWIKSNNKYLNPEDQILYDFDDIFRAFIEFLKNEQLIEVKFNPTQIFALFYCFCNDNIDLDIIITHMVYFAKEGNDKIKKKMWESNTESESRKIYFNECIEQIFSMTIPASPKDTISIPKSLKKEVWNKCSNNKCQICNKYIDKNTFETGHIRARALGGKSTIENLIPICFDCNRCMGIKDPFEYKREVYPELF